MGYRLHTLRWQMLLVLLALMLWPAYAIAQDASRTITSIEPSTLSQGETVLLTITGENLPTGTVVVEFFPQHIVLLDVLAANDREVLAQIKIPNLAAPGMYNILVYNHIGDEVFADGMLSVTGTLITPVFRDYSPKEFGAAEHGFALLLTGDAVTEGAIPFLSMRWTINGEELPRLDTTFSKGAPGQAVCAITGDIPGGVLQGRVYLRDKPIYIVEITVQSASGILIGHHPLSFLAEDETYAVEIIGTGFDVSFLRAVSIELATPQLTARPASVSLRDDATISAVFTGPLPAGVYSLVVSQNGELVYSGEVELTATATPVDNIETAGEVQPDNLTLEQVDTEPTPPITSQITDAEVASISLRDVADNAGQQSVAIDSVAPLAIAAGGRPASLAVSGVGLSVSVVERLELSLTVDGSECPLLFLGAGEGSFTCLFGAADQSWVAGDNAIFTITDPLDSMEPYRIALSVEGRKAAPTFESASLSPQLSETQAAQDDTVSGQWSVGNVYVKSSVDGGTLMVSLDSPGGQWDPALLEGSFVLIPKSKAINRAFSNITTSGALAFYRSESGAALGSYSGNFVSGDLLVKVSYGGGHTTVSSLSLDAPLPRAELRPPAVEHLLRNTQSGTLQPESVRLVVEFAPLVVSDPSFLFLEFIPEVTPGCMQHPTSHGTQVVFMQEMTDWAHVDDWSDGLSCSVDSTISLDWVLPPRFNLPVIEAGTTYSELTFTIEQGRGYADNDGFDVLLVPSSELPPLAQLSNVVLTSDDPLLGRNVEKFSAYAAAANVDGMPAVLLRFQRDRELLSDIANEILAEGLISNSPVNISLYWDELDVTVDASVVFIRRERQGSNDPLEELSLRQVDDQ